MTTAHAPAGREEIDKLEAEAASAGLAVGEIGGHGTSGAAVLDLDS